MTQNPIVQQATGSRGTSLSSALQQTCLVSSSRLASMSVLSLAAAFASCRSTDTWEQHNGSKHCSLLGGDHVPNQ